MRVLIIEDEPLVARDIENLILRLEPGTAICGTLSSVEAAREWFASNPEPDLILADIQLSDGTSFEIFDFIRPKCPVIFTTAYDNYAVRAFKLNSIDYLLKPIDGNELATALQKYRSVTGKSVFEEQLSSLIRNWGAPQATHKARFLVQQGNSMIPVVQSEIACFHKEQLIFLHTMTNEKYVCEFHALDDVEELLDPALFFRVNRQYIIHAQSIARIKSTHKGLTVVLKNPVGLEIDISREKAAAFKKWLG